MKVIIGVRFRKREVQGLKANYRVKGIVLRNNIIQLYQMPTPNGLLLSFFFSFSITTYQYVVIISLYIILSPLINTKKLFIIIGYQQARVCTISMTMTYVCTIVLLKNQQQTSRIQ